jgi:hypothetical protein
MCMERGGPGHIMQTAGLPVMGERASCWLQTLPTSRSTIFRRLGVRALANTAEPVLQTQVKNASRNECLDDHRQAKHCDGGC